MSDYQKQILDRVKTQINEWLESLKEKSPELLLTRQWRIAWLKGFRQGQNIMPVITSCKEGEYKIGEIQIMLPPSLELDLEAVELVLKDEPYEAHIVAIAVPGIDGPLDMLNDLVVGINGFLAGMPLQGGSRSESETLSPFTPLKVHTKNGHATSLSTKHRELEETILKSPFPLEWFKHIDSRNVARDGAGAIS